MGQERKIIQITSNVNNGYDRVTALCDDNTVWAIVDGVNIWQLLPPIPVGVKPKSILKIYTKEKIEDIINNPYKAPEIKYNEVLDMLAGAYIEGQKEEREKKLSDLTDEERIDIFSKYCKYCGCTDPQCQCWNDD